MTAPDESADPIGLTGRESCSVTGLTALNDGFIPRTVTVRADDIQFAARVRLDTAREADC